MQGKCPECIFVRKEQVVDNNRKPVVGQYRFSCFRFPPTAILQMTPQGMMHGSAFPTVTAENYCAEFDDGSDDPDEPDTMN